MTTPKSNKKVLNLFDVSMMTVAGVFGMRWIPVAAGLGPSSLLFWLVGAICFFIPLSIIVIQFSKIHSKDGGIYLWSANALGEKHGFIVAWCYWVTNLFSYPAILIFLSTSFAYFLGKPEYANSHLYTTITVICFFWLIVLINLYGLKIFKYFSAFGSVFGVLLPAISLLVLATIAYLKFGSATSFSPENFIPNGSIYSNLSSLTILMFAMAGVEVIPTLAESIKDSGRTLYISVIFSAILIFALYSLSSIAMNIVASPDVVQKSSGLVETFRIIGTKLSIPSYTRICSLLFVIGEIVALSVWLIAPAVMFFKCTPKGVLPKALHKVNSRGTPVNALIFQGILISIIIIATNFLDKVNSMYEVLVLASSITFFVPYIYLAIAYIKSLELIKVNKILGILCGGIVIISILLGIGFSFIPSPDLKSTHERIIFFTELGVGSFVSIYIGFIIYKFKK